MILAVWRNPLARGADRIEAALGTLVLSIWLLALPIVATTGSRYWQAVSTMAADEQQTREPDDGSPDG